jgi:hypothetical protein
MYRFCTRSITTPGTSGDLSDVRLAHGLEDSIEKITHSICTLEFENHRPLYDWFFELGIHPRSRSILPG